jgi:hypothetical protein
VASYLFNPFWSKIASRINEDDRFTGKNFPGAIHTEAKTNLRLSCSAFTKKIRD